MGFIQQIDSDNNLDRIRMEKNQTGIKIELAKDSNMIGEEFKNIYIRKDSIKRALKQDQVLFNSEQNLV